MSSYDQNLLDAVPKATRAQLQEGYNVDLLEQPPRRTPSVHSPPPPRIHSPAPVPVPGIPESSSGEKLSSPAYTSAASKSRTSFWRSRNGIITLIAVALIVVGAVVGGAVGGTVKKNSSSNSVNTTGTQSNSSSGSSSTSTAIQGFDPNTGSVGSPATAGRPTSTQGQNTGG